MSKTVKVQEAKTRLSGLLTEVEHGQEIVIARGDAPVAKLTPIHEAPKRELGFVPYHVPSEFFDPLPDEELAAWEG